MRVLNLLAGALVWIACVSVAAQTQKPQDNSAAACARCHAAQASTQPQTPMARALELPDANPTLKANQKLTFHRGDYTYTVETQGTDSTYTVTDGKRTISLPIHWSFGSGGQTWVFEREGQWYETLASYYPILSGLDVTIGDERLDPHTLEEAIGRPLAPSETRACFGCHASNAVSDTKLTLQSLQPGVTCEHCHVGSNTHLLDAVHDDFESAPPKLGKMSTEDISSFCGQCHRTWESVVRGRFHGEINVRFQPYRLANSKCYDGTDPRISCVACHDPHQDLVRKASFYDSKCLACHASSPHVSSASVSTASAAAPIGKACPVAKSDCVSCHMPKVDLPGGHMKFTDHEIRIVKAGEPYPN